MSMTTTDLEAAIERRPPGLIPDDPQERRMVRLEAGVTVIDLARVVGADPWTVARWERSAKLPRLARQRHLYAIAMGAMTDYGAALEAIRRQVAGQ